MAKNEGWISPRIKVFILVSYNLVQAGCSTLSTCKVPRSYFFPRTWEVGANSVNFHGQSEPRGLGINCLFLAQM